MLVRALRKVAGLLYRKADHIVVVTHAFKKHLQREWAVPAEKISVVVNGVDDKVFRPQATLETTLKEFDLHGRFVVGYIGTIGNAHGIETLVALAEQLNLSEPEVFFLVVGEGAERERLEQLAAERCLTNLRVFSGQPRYRIPEIIAASQICLVLLKKSELFKTVIPTKMLEFMSCARPLVAGVEGEAADLINKSRCGICVTPGDAPALADAIRVLYRNKTMRQQMGANGREFVVRQLSRESTAETYLNVLESMTGIAAKTIGAPRRSDAGREDAVNATQGKTL
jgi:glycosyltransferase involved in cell wall biosynthesis